VKITIEQPDTDPSNGAAVTETSVRIELGDYAYEFKTNELMVCSLFAEPAVVGFGTSPHTGIEARGFQFRIPAYEARVVGELQVIRKGNDE